VVDLDSGKESLALSVGPGGSSLSLSADGKTLAMAGYRSVGLWDLLLGKPIRVSGKDFGTHSRPVSVLALSPDGRWLASAAGVPQHLGDSPDTPEVKLWDVSTGKEVASFPGDGGFVGSLAFSPDGTQLLSGMWNGSVLVWDVVAATRTLKLQTRDLGPKELDALWEELTSADATKAHKAHWAMAAAPASTVPFLKKQVLPAVTVPLETIRRWIADLDSEKFAVRARASDQLRALGSQAEVPLSQALAGKPSLETRRRLEALLEAVQPTPSALLRSRRAIQVLEQIGTPEARQLLQVLAAGMPAAIRTREANAALERLGRRAVSPR
jgi:hypothetical protein